MSEDPRCEEMPRSATDRPVRLLYLYSPADEAHHAVFSPDGGLVATASKDGSAKLWRIGGALSAIPLRGHAAEVTGAAFSADGQQVFTAGGAGLGRRERTLSGRAARSRRWRRGRQAEPGQEARIYGER